MSQKLFEAVIGLEIHAQLMTKRKAFCEAGVDADALPNQRVGIVSAGLPGALPTLNREVVTLAAAAAIALNCRVASRTIFERKNYFYPDLPKGYQISQLAFPIGSDGYVDIYGEKSEKLRVGIDRIQIEEDAGKLSHTGAKTWVDLNRAGTPLVEIVSRPDIRTPAQAAAYMKTVYNALVFAKVCDGNLEKGNFRCDANVSVRRVGEEKLGTRTEIKNVNSFRFVEKAIDFEIARQIALIEAGGRVVQETRGWDAGTSTTYTMRVKEDAQDYRYFPDPDLPPVVLSEGWVKGVRDSMPPLPDQIVAELQQRYGLDVGLARTLGADPKYYQFFQSLLTADAGLPADLVAKWICGDLSHELKVYRKEVDELPFVAAQLATLLGLVHEQRVSAQNAKKLLRLLFDQPQVDLPAHLREKGLEQISDRAQLGAWIDEVLAAHAAAADQLRAGDLKIFDFLQGQVMKASRGRANPVLVSEILKEKLA
ncbi:MAG TPA: Asp-tRNA(Asn)/Glu-tRNA(Gln) amidotransferase subunit GatB [Bdellovibrionota bacterium]|jgi:aspartyl-tRNA(Asn)/glutamyl-tRNA(Gln) amidotransferase subunit B|nr:Asp-tRNA(Asn)/Glu-tRNA(Gln) amidotransferase subunit GatB [Bdellovibrionota bacterium]